MLFFATTNTYAEENKATTIGIGAKNMAAGNYLGAGLMIPFHPFGESKLADWFGLKGSVTYTLNKQKELKKKF